jgi:hypothetical protein
MMFCQKFNSHKKKIMNTAERGSNKLYLLSRFRAEIVELVCVLFWLVRLKKRAIN